jgi:basic amino acid/polyamine antiporter, APA family
MEKKFLDVNSSEKKLKKELSLWHVTLCGVGIIIGAGIYTLVGKAAGMAGNMVWLSFILAALAASTTGLSYAELSSVFPRAGAEFTYAKKAFGKRIGFVVGFMTLFSGIIASSAVALGFAGYFSAVFGTNIAITAVVLIILICALLFYGVKQSVWLAIIFTLIEAAGLIMIIFIGLPFLVSANINFLEVPPMGLTSVVGAAALIFFAFIGFEDMVNLAEDTKNPKKNMPRAVILAIFVTTIIYVLVGLAAVSIMPWQDLAVSNAPLAEVAQLGMNTYGFDNEALIILGAIALFATANTVLLLLMAMSRIAYGMGRAHSLPKVFAIVHSKRHTPWISIIVVGLLAMGFALIGKIESVANLANFVVFTVFIMVNLSMLKLRFSMPDKKRGFRVPLNIGKFNLVALVGIGINLYLLSNIEIELILYGIGLIIVGFLLEWYFKEKK